MYHMLYNSLQVGSFTADRLVVDLSVSWRARAVLPDPARAASPHPAFATANAVVINTDNGKG